MAAFHKSLCIFLPFFFTLLSSSQANTFNVGGKDGWTLHPSESYSQWTGRLRFLVNDTLHFKYNGGSDSVMVVNKGDYDACNTDSPIAALTGGDNSFLLSRTGPFYFISGNKSNCDQGQKLTVVVLSIRTKPSPPVSTPPAPATGGGASSPATPPGGATSPPGGGASSPASPPSGGASSPTSPSGGGASSPTSPPGGGASSPASPPSGGASSPASSPGGGASSPASSPGGSASSPGPDVSPVSSSPQSGPSGSTSPVSSPGGVPSSSPMANPADANGPPPRGSSSARPAIPAASTVSLAMVIFGLVWFY